MLCAGSFPCRAADGIADIEKALGGRIGIAAINPASHRSFRYRSHERFAMCSTFKASLAAMILRRAESGALSLEETIAYGKADLLPTSSVTAAHVDQGSLSIEELCQAAVEVSDNAAANLLLRRIDGPAQLTEFFRSIGDKVSRLDRMELELNFNEPGDPRDTTTPDAMIEDLKAFLLSDQVLTPPSRDRLTRWMINEQNGRNRIRSAVPPFWKVANKPGTNANGAVNDIAVVWPEGGSPIAICIYTDAPGATLTRSTDAIAAAAKAALAQIL